MTSSSTFKPTNEQVQIVDAAVRGENLRIQALSGTGKTSTEILIANAMPKVRGSYLTFNRSIADEAAVKMRGTKIQASTVHSRAFQALGKKYSHRLEGGERGRLTPLNLLKRYHYDKLAGISPLSRAGLVKQTLTNFLTTPQEQPEAHNVPIEPLAQLSTLEKFSEVDEAAIKTALAEDAKVLWEDMIRHDSVLPMLHDAYLKRWIDSNPSLESDLILVDEAQDVDPNMERLILNQDAQIIVVGDTNQQIYSWRAAKNIMTSPALQDWPTYYLSQSFRFSNQIAGAANNLLEYLKCDVPLRGTDVDRSHLAPTRAVLFRTNAGVFGELMKRTLKQEQSIYVAGGVTEMYAMLNAVEALQRGRQTAHPDFVGFDTWEQYIEASKAYNAPNEMRLLVNVVKEYPLAKLKDVVNSSQHVPEEESHVTLSTAHKAKGREWAYVAVGSDFTPPCDNPLMDNDKNRISDEEVRLQYVTLTRCQKNVYGAVSMIEAYRDRMEIQRTLDAVKDEPAHVRLATKMQFAPSLRDKTAFDIFTNNLEKDEVAAMSGKLEKMLNKGTSDCEPTHTPGL